MSKRDKLLTRLFSRPNDFQWDELVALLAGLGFEVINKKGPRFRFVHPGTSRKLMFHKPHPESTVKKYVIDQTIEVLADLGVTK
jgi:predicted RNA binding protein YcfA (HicA-like mRNA interferase family)